MTNGVYEGLQQFVKNVFYGCEVMIEKNPVAFPAAVIGTGLVYANTVLIENSPEIKDFEIKLIKKVAGVAAAGIKKSASLALKGLGKIGSLMCRHENVARFSQFSAAALAAYSGESITGKIVKGVGTWLGFTVAGMGLMVCSLLSTEMEKTSEIDEEPEVITIEIDQHPTDSLDFNPLSGERPSHVLDHSKGAFKYASEASYKFSGTADDYKFSVLNDINPRSLFCLKNGSAQTFIEGLLKEREESEGPLRVCDIGAAGGCFLSELPEGVEGVGVSASDDRGDKFLDSPHAEKYIVGDVEHLSKLVEPNSLDVCVSRVSFYHLTDPLRALSQAYETLKVGGHLLIDQFFVLGLKGRELEEMCTRLNERGYDIQADYEINKKTGDIEGFKSLKIRKTLDHLVLPIRYKDGLAERILNRPMPSFLSSSMSEEFRRNYSDRNRRAAYELLI
jgi:SAM-dependent methyltransferase